MDRHSCNVCFKTFAHVSSRDRHLKNIHQLEKTKKKKCNIYCPLCFKLNSKIVLLPTYDYLIQHLEANHKVVIKTEELNFNEADFQKWMNDQKCVNYTMRRKNKCSEGSKTLFYDCNRSYDGYQSKAMKRFPKAAGSIKICGTCPSRIVAIICSNGNVKVKYTSTHIGHDEELRCQRLTMEEKGQIVKKLQSGITKKRILEDARTVKGNKLRRLNLLTRKDLSNMERKFKKSRDSDDMTATAMKVLYEWNGSDNNFGFFFKQIVNACIGCGNGDGSLAYIITGEKHTLLRDEDFAVAFMNQVMERKLKQFDDIICMDGTHNTNVRGWELTTVLIKDDRGVGFPVAFLVSNRKDQLIYELFLAKLKEKIQVHLNPKYFMSDDDPKYYNAWVQVMESHPLRLLCSWHVVKNWIIQGRAKLKNVQLKKSMKTELRRILTETNEEKFMQLSGEYFKKLGEEHETEFLLYLQKYYFQDQNRIRMWAHCYRLQAGINTNMAIESLHKFIKYDELNKKRNNTIEKLLDILETVIEDKTWTRVIETVRPSASSYQQRIVRESHKKAENITNAVEEIKFGEFRVRSLNSNKSYKIMYGDRVCGDGCRLMYCTICKICFHRYICQCPQYAVKHSTCKHVHMVALYERTKYESALGNINQPVSVLDEHSYCEQTIKFNNETTSREEIELFIKDQGEENNDAVDDETFRRIKIETHMNTLNAMNMKDFKEIMEKIDQLVKAQQNRNLTKKRVQEKQSFFPV